MARSNDDLTLRVGFDIDKFQQELRKTNSTLTNWSAGVQKSILGLGAAFSGLALGRFVLDVSKLAGEAEGVSAAFVKLENSAKLMQDLKAATGGTVSELELMKRSVMASNFDISLKALPQLLEFATLRARQTGQSVDYLVDSIVTGIGRKSKLILDNLGISAVQLTEALGGASAASSTIGEVAEAVGKIASENLIKMGKLTDDAAVRADRLNASWANLKVTFGQIVNESGLSNFFVTIKEDLETINDISDLLNKGKLSDPIAELNRQMSMYNSGQPRGFEKIEAYNNLQEAARAAGVQLIRLFDSATKVSKVFIKPTPVTFLKPEQTEEQVRNIKFLEESIKSLQEEIQLSGSRSQIAKYQGEIKELQKEIDALMGKTEEAFNKYQAMFNKDTMAQRKEKGLGEFTSVSLPKMFPDFNALADHITKLVDKSNAKAKEFTDNWQQTQERMANNAAMIGDAIGVSIGEIMAGTESVGAAIARMARNVVASLERIALAYMIANSAKFGLAGIAGAAAGFALVRGAFNQIGRNEMSESRASNMNRWQMQSVNSAEYRFRVEGRDLVSVIDNENRASGRSRP